MELTEEQLMIRDMARQFGRERLAPGAAERDRQSRFPAEELAEMAALGLYGITVPVEWQGAGAGYVAFALAIEEIAAVDAACSTILSVNNSLVCGILLNYGSEFQKSHYLSKLASGEYLGCFCLTEPQAGSDAAALTVKAVRDGDDYLISGTKQFITSGQNADVAIVFAVTDPAAGKKGISAFVVPTSTPGYQVASLEQKMGQKSSDTAQIVFDQCRVSQAHRIGEEGEGYRIALSNLEAGRIGIAAQSVGMARAALMHALAYAEQRESFGKPIFNHQAISFRLADMATQVEAAHALVMQAASMRDRGEPCLKEACMAKLFASEAAEQVCSDAIQVLGGYGYLNDFPLERIYRDVRVAKIYEGTSDIQRLIIARQLQSSP